MPQLAKTDLCCGCAACANKCAKGAISMQPNTEGFLHPVIDNTICVECGLCEKTCPGLKPAKKTDNSPLAFIVQHNNDAIRYQSTSGGAFTAIAQEVIKRGGVVFGAIMTDELRVKHDCVATIEELAKFRNSKYVQSEIGECFKLAKKILSEGQMVCFSGTPCQINGLYKFLGRDYDNLISVDVTCKSVPSPLVFEKYKEFKSQKTRKAKSIVFRDKKRGFSYCTMAHYDSLAAKEAGDSFYRRSSESDEWLRLFLSGKISRRSCATCSYQTISRVGDFTLWDCWETTEIAPKWNDNKGTTNVVVWTDKAKLFFESVKDNVRYCQYPIENTVNGVERESKMTHYALREQLFKDVHNLTAEAFFGKYSPYTIKVKVKQAGRYLMWRFHLHNLARRVKHLIIHRKK